MSFDLFIIDAEQGSTLSQIRELYKEICDGSYQGPPQESERVDLFMAKLFTLYSRTEDADPDDIERAPWSVRPCQDDMYAILCIVWSQANSVFTNVLRLTQELGLHLYDPQSDTLHVPMTRSSI